MSAVNLFFSLASAVALYLHGRAIWRARLGEQRVGHLLWCLFWAAVLVVNLCGL